jgi:predicted AlkP superfamily phosphohydrolase/phosphomutase
MAEDHTGCGNGRLDANSFIAQCNDVLREREAMLQHELGRWRQGLLFCLFDTPDRLAHMLWRYREPNHPANRDEPIAAELQRAIELHYRDCDAVVGRALAAAAGERTLVIVLSDHGMTSYQRGVHLNSWLCQQGLMTLLPGVDVADPGECFAGVDWGRTQAYALGLGGIYLNQRGREPDGCVEPADAAVVGQRITAGLTALRDGPQQLAPVRAVRSRAEVYRGSHAASSPDWVVDFAAGYRASWATTLGGRGWGTIEDNTRRWGGDHAIDPALVPGVLFCSAPLAFTAPDMLDLAPTILAALGVPRAPRFEGRSLLG